MSDRLDEVVALLLTIEDECAEQFMDEHARDHRDFAESREWWGRVVKSLEASPEHCGDCTNVPMTCTRCLVEDYRERARLLMGALWDGDLSAALREAEPAKNGD